MKYKDFYFDLFENIEPIELFHGTSEPYEKIKAEGLRMFGNGVYLTDNPQLAIEYAESDAERTENNNILLISLNLKDLDESYLQPDADHGNFENWKESLSECDQLIYTKNIPPNILKIKKIELLLQEMPVDIDYGNDSDGLDLPNENKIWTEFAKKNGTYKGKINVGGNSYNLYIVTESSQESGKVRKSYYFLDETQKETLASHHFKEFLENGKKAIQTTLLWKSKKIKGFMKEWFKQFVTKEYDIIYSDQAITKNGLQFWIWMFYNFVPKGMKMYIFDKSNNSKKIVNSPTDLEKNRASGKINIFYALYTK